MKAAPLPAKREDALCRLCINWRRERPSSEFGECRSIERRDTGPHFLSITTQNDTCEAFLPKYRTSPVTQDELMDCYQYGRVG